jgi:ankyrin repeat protein
MSSTLLQKCYDQEWKDVASYIRDSPQIELSILNGRDTVSTSHCIPLIFHNFAWFYQAGYTALHYACSKGQIEIVEGLHKKGADLSILDNVTWTCMSISLATINSNQFGL